MSSDSFCSDSPYCDVRFPLLNLCIASAISSDSSCCDDLFCCCITCASPLHHLCTTCASSLHHLCITVASPLHALCITSVPPLHHLYITSASHHLCTSISRVSPTTRLSYGGANVTIFGVGFNFLSSAAHDKAAAATVSATAIVGLNAIKASTLMNTSVFTTPVPQVQLHGLGSAIQYLGCYRDDGSMLTLFADKLQHHTVASCLAFCSDANFTYAALNMGYQCRCGNWYGPSAGSEYVLAESAEAVIAANGEQSKDAKCRLGCSGFDDIYNVPRLGWSCGGPQRSAVYTRAISVPCSLVSLSSENFMSLECRVPPLFSSLKEYLGADAAYADKQEICDKPSDSMAEEICYTIPRNYAPSSTRQSYTLALVNGVCASDCTISFSSLATPHVVSIEPSHGAAGDVVHIQGSGFSADTEHNNVQEVSITLFSMSIVTV